jgi:putative peptide zinc metalloprotease protein
MPFPTSVSAPAVLQAASYATIYAPMPGCVSQVLVRDGQRVMAGEQVVVLENPSLEKEVRLAEIKAAMWNYRLDRQAGYDQDRMQRQVIAESLKAGLAELAGLKLRQENLILKAPVSGMIRDHADSLIPGRWIDQKLPVVYLIDARHAEIEGLVSVDELAYIDVGQSARFIPADLTRASVEAQVVEVAEVDERDVAIPYFASIFAGDMAVRKDDKGRLKPEVSVYRVRLSLRDAIRDADQAVLGHIQIQGQPSSLAKRVWDHTVAVLIRESGF